MDRWVVGALMAAVALVATGCRDTPTSAELDLSPEFRAFLVATKELDTVVVEISGILQGIGDPQAAAAAKPRLAALAPKLEEAARKAAAAAVGMQGSARARKEMTRMHIERTAADAKWADRVRTQFGLEEQKDAPPNLIEAMIKAAQSPNATPLAGELASIRDIILRSRAPLAPPRVREIVEKALGPAGSPLQTGRPEPNEKRPADNGR